MKKNKKHNIKTDKNELQNYLKIDMFFVSLEYSNQKSIIKISI